MYPFEYHGATVFNSNPQFFSLRFKKFFNQSGYQWSRNQWQGGRNFYTGTATAGRGATLAGLAEMITGDGNDWRELSKTENVISGQIVQVAPLLKKLELLMRLKTVAAIGKFNAAGFNSPEVTVSIDDNSAKALNLYFGSTSFGSPDCDSAAAIIQAKGLLDTIGEVAFNAFGLSPGTLPIKITKGSLGGMLLGDRGWIQNFTDYQGLSMLNTGSGGAYQAENVIKVGRNRFWGFIEAPRKGVKNAQEWELHLRAEYKKVGGNPNKPGFPGFDGEIRFVNVAEIAGKVFDLRRKNA